MLRFDLTRSPDDANNGIPLLEAGLSDRNNVVRTWQKRHTALAYLRRFEAFARPTDVERALAHLLDPANDPAIVTEYDFVTLIANAFRAEARLTSDPEFFATAAERLRSAVNRPELSDGIRAKLMDEIGLCHHQCYEMTGDDRELDEAIRIRTRAIELAGNGELPVILNNLADSLRRRFERSGIIADLEAASRHVRRALVLAAPSGPVAAELLNAWGGIAREFFFRDGQTAWLDKAIEAFEQSIAMQEDREPTKALALTNLGLTLADRAAETGSPAEIGVAIRHLELAVRLTARTDIEMVSRLLNLSAAHLKSYDFSRSLADLEPALDVLATARSMAAPGSYGEAVVLGNYAAAKRRRFDATGLDSDALDATNAYRSCCALARRLGRPVALTIGLDWGGWASDRNRWEEAAEAFEFSFEALDGLTSSQSDFFGQQSWIGDAQTLGARACYAYAKAGDVKKAALSIERARARLLGAHLRRQDVRLETLRTSGHGDLLDKYQALVTDIQRRQAGERLIASIAYKTTGERFHRSSRGLSNTKDPTGYNMADLFAGKIVENQMRLGECIAEIRALSGFESFMGPPNWDDVATVLDRDSATEPAADVLLYLAVTASGGVALIISERLQQAVFLDRLDMEMLSRIFSKHGYAAVQRDDNDAIAALSRMMGWLCEAVMDPIRPALSALFDPQDKAVPRSMLLIPSGPLSILPLHACQLSPGGEGDTLLDRFVVQYGLSAITWRHCRRIASDRRDASPSILAVGNPHPLHDGYDDLLGAEAEAEAVALKFGEAAILLCGRAATNEAVEEQLARFSYLHFACHGTFDIEHPSESSLLLGNGELSLIHLIVRGERIPARLVVMSACQTALVDLQRYPEEPVGLPAGFIEAGSPAAIGTFWSIDDVPTALLVDHLYNLLLEPQQPELRPTPAEALRRAQIWLRGVTRQEVEQYLRESVIGQRLAAKIPDIRIRGAPFERPFEHPIYWAPFSFHGA